MSDLPVGWVEAMAEAERRVYRALLEIGPAIRSVAFLSEHPHTALQRYVVSSALEAKLHEAKCAVDEYNRVLVRADPETMIPVMGARATARTADE